MIGFASIIYRDHFFKDQLPILTKLVMISACIHQLVFTLFSTLPFSIGQVQDAGLIFLSSMASSIVSQMQDENKPDDEILSTVLITLSLCTVLLGIALILTGYFRLAQLVQYLPMPVVGGYLAFIGLYCGEAGLSMMSGLQVDGPASWPNIVKNTDALLYCTPGVVTGICLLLMLHKFHHFLLLPGCMVAINVLFYVTMLALGHGLSDMQGPADHVAVSGDEGYSLSQHAWVAAPTGSVECWDVWKLYWTSWGAFSRNMHVLPAIIPTWLAMYFVVAFSSSLDVAAIQMELQKPLDFDGELMTVGLSNLVSGSTGGYTGSYIFSQTIFTLRAGVTKSRACGFTVVVLELVIFLVPTSVLAYIPRMFFGAILTFICCDLLVEWLWQSRKQVTLLEYFIIWATFIAINATNLEVGMGIGIGISLLCFVLQYSRSASSEVTSSRSRVVRNETDRAYLRATGGDCVVTLKLHGYIFFGSSLNILRDVQHAVLVKPVSLVKPSSANQDVKGEPADIESSLQAELLGVTSLDGKVSSDSRPATRFLVLDFAAVSGCDTTAARSCFLTLGQELRQHKVQLVVTGLSDQVRAVLTAQGMIPAEGEELDSERIGEEEGAMVFPTASAGVEWCEETLLAEGPSRDDDAWSETIHTGASDSLTKYLSKHDICGLGSSLWEPEVMHAGQTIFSYGHVSDCLYIIEEGEVTLQFANELDLEEEPVLTERERADSITGSHRGSFVPAAFADDPDKHKMIRYVNAGIFGDMDFFLQQPRSFTAACSTECRIHKLPYHAFEKLLQDSPQSAIDFQTAIIRSLCLTVSDNLDVYIR